MKISKRLDDLSSKATLRDQIVKETEDIYYKAGCWVHIVTIIGLSYDKISIRTKSDMSETRASFAIMNNKDCLPNFIKESQRFSTLSGLKINVDKTEILLLGTATPLDIPEEYRPLIKTAVKILGVVLTTDHIKTISLNYTPAIEKMATTIRLWNNRKLYASSKGLCYPN